MDDLTKPLTVEQVYGPAASARGRGLPMYDNIRHPRDRSRRPTCSTSRATRFAAPPLDLAERTSDVRGLAVDPVQASLNLRRPRTSPPMSTDISWTSSSAPCNDIPVGHNTFHAIFSRGTTGHVQDLPGALSERRRALRAGGAMAIHDVFATALLGSRRKSAAAPRRSSPQVPERLRRPSCSNGQPSEAVVRHRGRPTARHSEWLETLLEG